MSKQIKQIRFYGTGDSRNYPFDDVNGYISVNQLVNYKFFEQYMPITQIGIQTLPGTKFYLNDITATYPIIIGYTGIYELNLTDIAEINSLFFDLDSILTIDKTDDAYLIIDIVYGEE